MTNDGLLYHNLAPTPLKQFCSLKVNKSLMDETPVLNLKFGPQSLVKIFHQSGQLRGGIINHLNHLK